jgi:hypothetical protein
VTREVLGYVLGRRAWCLRCATPTAPADARPVLGVPGRAQALTCVACGDDLGDPAFGKSNPRDVRPAAAVAEVHVEPREESDMSKKHRTAPKAKASKAAKNAKPAKATAPAERHREFKRDPRLPAVGSKITKSYKGKDLTIEVQDDGLVLDGTRYASAAARARAITGAASINGMLWLGLATPKAKADPKRKPAKASA